MCLRKLKMCSKRIFIFALLCISCVVCEKKPCDMDDNKCLTVSAERTFVEFISGMPGVEPSDPLRLDSFEVNLPYLKYKLSNGSLTGLKHCHVELVQFSEKDKKYHTHIGCPHLVFESKYEVKGKVGPEVVEGKGACKVFFFNYNFLFNGDYERKDCNDKKNHIQLRNSKLELEAKGKVHYDFENLFNGNKAKSDAVLKFANENWQYVDKLIRQPGMDAFMKTFIDNVNAYLRKIPIEELFIEENTRPISALKL